LSEIALNVRPIHTDAGARDALGGIAVLMPSKPAPAASKVDRFDILATLLQACKPRHDPIDAADPVEAIRFRMASRG
jgi:HTH-type transcriptional regulator / antitoxin HigA